MFGLSTELVTKGKLVHLEEIRVLTLRALALRGFALTNGRCSKRQHSNLFKVINQYSFLLPTDAASQFLYKLSLLCMMIVPS